MYPKLGMAEDTEAKEMNDEKISLRIEADELERIDAYLAEHPEEGSRSLFVKNCIRERLNRDAGTPAVASKAGNVVVTVELPGKLAAAIDAAVDEEYYADASDYIRTVLRDKMSGLREKSDKAIDAAAQRAEPGSR